MHATQLTDVDAQGCAHVKRWEPQLQLPWDLKVEAGGSRGGSRLSMGRYV